MGRDRSPARRLLAAGALAVALGFAMLQADALRAPGASADAPGAPGARLEASLSPKRPGHSTTLRLRVRISPPSGAIAPPPLLSAQLLYPAALDLQLSGLGILACPILALELLGPKGCPADSVMGFGNAIAELQIKHELFRETAKIAVVRAAGKSGNVAMTIAVYEEPALSAQILLPSELLAARHPFGGRLAIDVPLVSTFPEGPDVSVGAIELTLGPRGLRYSERVHGKTIRYEPAGIPLSGPCPKGGYPFAVQLSFLGGEEAHTRTSVPCPRGRSASSPKISHAHAGRR